MRHIEHNKEYRCKCHQPYNKLVTFEIHILMIGLTDHGCSFIFIQIWAVHHLIICQKISIRWLLLLLNLITTLSIYRKSFDQVWEKEVFCTTTTLFNFSVPLGVICVILFEASFIIYNFTVWNLYLDWVSIISFYMLNLTEWLLIFIILITSYITLKIE